MDELRGRLNAFAGITLEASNGNSYLNPPARQLVKDAAELARAAEVLLTAMDDMHARGETFTARVSIAAYDVKKALSK